VPVLPARPRRLISVVGVGPLGLAVGIGATPAVHGLRGGGDRCRSASLLARAGRLLPVATATVIVAVGLALAAQGAAQL
jgi:hypothetical protein